MIETIFFDFDGVLTTDPSGSYTTCQYIQKIAPDLKFDDILACYRQHHQQLLLGHCTHQDIWADFCACIGVELSSNVLTKAFQNTPCNEGMFDLCHSLKSHYQLGIITDNSKDRFDTLKEYLNLPTRFKHIIVSSDIGSRKDSEHNFKTALQLANAQAEACVFIDNNAANLIMPDKLGFHTIFYDHKKNDLDGLKRKLQDLEITWT